jgi:cytochrome c peroxidase
METDQLTNKPIKNNYLRIGAIILGATLLFCQALPGSAMAADLSPIEQLGKYLFFDNISDPDRMSCSTCHTPRAGWTYPVSGVNLHQVVATGADPHTFGNRKPPSNAYATFSPKFTLAGPNGGNFWDGRSIGFGGDTTLTDGITPVSHTEVIGPEIIDSANLDAATKTLYKTYLIPTADQALNPLPNPVEQNILEQEVVLHVASAKYAPLWKTVWGEPIVCSSDIVPNTGGKTVCQVNYRRIAVALAAYQASTEVNSFSCKLDKAIEEQGNYPNPPVYPLPGLTEQENRGHDLFYGNAALGIPRNCAFFCHNSGGAGSGTDAHKKDAAGNIVGGELYTGEGYFNIGVPANPEIPGYDPASPDLGLFNRTGIETHKGLFKVPTMRNVDKRPDATFVKAYTHNGFFKSLEEIVHFYNTRDVKGQGVFNGEDWPAPEVAENVNASAAFGKPGHHLGDLGLTPQEEADIVAYLKTLTDTFTVQEPKPYKGAK